MNLLAQVIIRRGLAFVPLITYPHGADWNLLKLTRSYPFDFSAESQAKAGIDALRKNGRYKPLTP
jgi:hypothetical protein